MKRLMTLCLAGGLLAGCLAGRPARPEKAAIKAQPIDVVLCLDTSNSMDGLIDSAKTQAVGHRQRPGQGQADARPARGPVQLRQRRLRRQDRLGPQGARPDHRPRRGLPEALRPDDQRRHRVRRPRLPRRPRSSEVVRGPRALQDDLRLRQRAGRRRTRRSSCKPLAEKAGARASSSTRSTAAPADHAEAERLAGVRRSWPGPVRQHRPADRHRGRSPRRSTRSWPSWASKLNTTYVAYGKAERRRRPRTR